MNDRVLMEIDGGVATLTLNRPQALNALDRAMTDAIAAAVARCEMDPGIKAVVLRGGEHFMAGGDLKEFVGHIQSPAADRRTVFESLIHEVHASIETLRRMPKPVVAGVRGACAGFGFSLMMACDLAVAAEDAYFTLAYINIGTSPDGGSTFHLPRIVGVRKAMELALLGNRFGAAEAKDLGLVNQVVPSAEVDAAALALAKRLAAGPGLALGRTKRLINASLDNSLEAQLQAEAENFAACTATSDFAEGLTAFLEKRKPAFKGA
ncbi:MAG TPA: enoyl-CoA hydratase [Azospirillaceae bacterium]|nr:enoyl-CoA hydratase [Azospirillaceae bacterium]